MNATNEIDVSSTLISVINEGDLESVKSLIQTHGLAHCDCGNGGYTLLFVAIRLGHDKIARFLLQEGAKVDCKTDSVCTPLHLAASQGFTKLVRLLLEKNVRIDARNSKNETPLHLAAKKGYTDIVETLLNENASMIVQTDENLTPLFSAIAGRHEKVVRMLFQHACTNLKVSQTRNSILLEHVLLCSTSIRVKVSKLVTQIVIHGGVSKIIDELIDHGFVLGNEYVNDSLLSAVVEKNYVKLMDSILRNGADPTDGKYDPLLLHSAVKIGQKEIVKLFVESGFNTNAKDEAGKTCLCYSLNCNEEEKCVKVIKLLLANDAGIQEAPTLLHKAVKKGFIKVCKILIENGADLNVLNKSRETPLHLAVSINKSRDALYEKQKGIKLDETIEDQITKLLLLSGANIRIETPCQDTGKWYPALHHAVLSGRQEAVSVFLEFGVDVDLRARNGTTPLMLASHNGIVEIVEMLCKNNADVNIGPAGALFTATIRMRYEVVRVLLKFGAGIDFDIDGVLRESSEFSIFNSEVISMILKEHAIKLKIAGFWVSGCGHNLDYLTYGGFRKECKKEIKRMKKQKIDSQFTLYDVLVNSDHLSYAKNKPLMRTLKHFHFGAFPLYENIITSKLRVSRYRLELLLSGQKWLDVLIKTSSKLNEEKYCMLPVEILEQIVLYLSNSEIKSLIFCGKALKRQAIKK